MPPVDPLHETCPLVVLRTSSTSSPLTSAPGRHANSTRAFESSDGPRICSAKSPAAQDVALDIPDEQRITIQENGQVVLNDLALDNPASKELPALFSTLKRFKQSADANKSEALITIDVDDSARHQRVVDVLDVCARAGIRGVTFAGAAGDEE